MTGNRIALDSAGKDAAEFQVPVLCLGCEARITGICSALEPSELVRMASHTHKIRHGAGSRVSGESDPITSYANVMRGVIKLSKVMEDGAQQVVGLQFAPDFLGRLYGNESTVTVEAATEVHLCVVPRGALERMVATTPALERRLIHQTLRELDDARDWMVTLGRKSARQKVASLLWLFASHAKSGRDGRDDLHFDLPLTRADIGDFLGLTFETVSRQVTRLRVDGVIQVIGNRHVKVPDLRLLQEMCG